MQSEKQIINTSGTGATAKVPSEIANRFNWGAFLLDWIWGVFNKTWIPLISLFLGIIQYIISMKISIYFNNVNSRGVSQPIIIFNLISFCILLLFKFWYGIKGNTWAWQNKAWKDSKHFHTIQKTWAMAGIAILIGLSLFYIFIFFICFSFELYKNKMI